MTEQSEVRGGVRKRCILLPILFLFIISDIIHGALTGKREGIQWTMSPFLKPLAYVNDIYFISHRVMRFCQMALDLETKASEVRLSTKLRLLVCY